MKCNGRTYTCVADVNKFTFYDDELPNYKVEISAGIFYLFYKNINSCLKDFVSPHVEEFRLANEEW